MKKDKKSIVFVLLIFLIFIILSIKIFFLISPDDNKEKINMDNSYIFEQDHSIYNGTDPEIIAERFAKTLNESPIKSKQIKSCCGGNKLWKFKLQNDNHFSIEIRQLENNDTIIIDMSLAQSVYHEKNESYDANYAKEYVLNFTKKFLEMFDVELGYDYKISVIPWHGNKSWQVDIYQLYKGEVLNWSGFHLNIDRENGEIRTMDIGEWLDPKSLIIENITIEDGQKIIYNELKEDMFNITVPYSIEYYDEKNDTHCSYMYEKNHTIPINLTDIEFIEYKALWGRLAYTYEINYQINETKTCTYRYIIDAESGKKLLFKRYSGNSGREKTYYNNLI